MSRQQPKPKATEPARPVEEAGELFQSEAPREPDEIAPIPAVEIPPVAMRIYVAGPYTVPNPEANTQKAMEAMLQLIRKGHYPFCPHLSHYPDAVARRIGRPVTWEEWMEQDLVWLAQCEALLRLPGASKGADLETAEADRLRIPVYASLADVPNVSGAAQLRFPDGHDRPGGVSRPFCKSCGLELPETVDVKRERGPFDAACPDCVGWDFNKCPDCLGPLCHPGGGNALADLGYDRVCVDCSRTFVWANPRTYGRRRG